MFREGARLYKPRATGGAGSGAGASLAARAGNSALRCPRTGDDQPCWGGFLSFRSVGGEEGRARLVHGGRGSRSHSPLLSGERGRAQVARRRRRALPRTESCWCRCRGGRRRAELKIPRRPSRDPEDGRRAAPGLACPDGAGGWRRERSGRRGSTARSCRSSGQGQTLGENDGVFLLRHHRVPGHTCQQRPAAAFRARNCLCAECFPKTKGSG